MTLPLHQRELLLDAVRPPPGMTLDAAVGTTFTLDLLALLAIPVAIAFRRPDEPASGEEERIDVIESVRQSADRTLIFCQTGLISVPRRYRPAFVWTEDSVVEVGRPKKGRLFHPKVWVFRFSDGAGAVQHRVLVLSRNLTFDRSWDAMVRLDEDSQANPSMDMAGLVRFLKNLPILAKTPLDARQTVLLTDLTSSVAGARLALPPGFGKGEFWPLGGTSSKSWPFATTCDNSLAVSPFLGPAATKRFAQSGAKWSGLVSRAAGLRDVHAALTDVNAYELKSTAVSAELSELPDSEDGDTSAKNVAEGTPLSLRGLHAKMYVQDTGAKASMWVGSANLTEAAFHGNVELLVRLDGDSSTMGVDQLMGFGETDRLDHLVTGYVGDTPEVAESEEGLDLLDHLAIDLGEAVFVTAVVPSSAEQYDLTVAVSGLPELPTDVEMRVRPMTLPRHFLELIDGTAAWTNLTLTRLTPFVVVRLSSGAKTRQFVVRSLIEGDPPHRRSAVLAACIQNREDFLKYLATLLGYDSSMVQEPGVGSGGGWVPGIRADRILEDLLTTAAREPKRLQFLDGLLTELGKSPQGADVVPEEFIAVWKSVRSTIAHHWDRVKQS